MIVTYRRAWALTIIDAKLIAKISYLDLTVAEAWNRLKLEKYGRWKADENPRIR